MSYLNQRIIAPLTTIYREARLPEGAVGAVRALEGQAVEVRDKVARGFIPERHIIIEAAKELRLTNPASLKQFMLVKERTRVAEQDPLAGRDAKRGRRVFAPCDGIVMFVSDGRIILQATPRTVELEAGVRGTVEAVYPNQGLRIQASGALLQGVWGNGHNLLAVMRLEPPNGLDSIPRDSFDLLYKGEIVVTARPLTRVGLEIAEERSFGGIIAPSMDIDLLEDALKQERAIMLTEGFGDYRFGPSAELWLRDFNGQQALLDAYRPTRWAERYPEVIVNRGLSDDTGAYVANPTLKRGLRVRITAAPHYGELGRITELLNQPLLLPSGLRVPAARIELGLERVVDVPLANLEVAGK